MRDLTNQEEQDIQMTGFLPNDVFINLQSQFGQELFTFARGEEPNDFMIWVNDEGNTYFYGTDKGDYVKHMMSKHFGLAEVAEMLYAPVKTLMLVENPVTPNQGWDLEEFILKAHTVWPQLTFDPNLTI